MKHLLILFLIITCLEAEAQKINFKSFSVKRVLPADVSQWGPDAANAVAQSSNPQGGTVEVKMIITIKSNGSRICGNNLHTAPYENVTTKTIGAKTISMTMGDCILKPGPYSLCIEFFSGDGKTVSGEQCREFTVAAPKSQTEPVEPVKTPIPSKSLPMEDYRRPDLTAPANNTTFKPEDLRRPPWLKWTPVTPTPPQGDVLYTVRVFEVLRRQQPAQAVKSNQPIWEKEVKTPQAMWQPSPEYTSTKESKTFVWNVQATNRAGKSYGPNNGVSEYAVFSIVISNPSEGCFEVDTTDLQVTCNGFDANGRPIYLVNNLRLKNIGSNPGQTGLHNTPTSNYLTSANSTVTNIVPASATNIAPGNSINIAFELTNPISQTPTIVVNSTILDPGGNFSLFCDKSIGITLDTLPICICRECDNITLSFSDLQATLVSTNSSQYDISATVNANVPVFGLEFQVQSYNYSASPATCTNGVPSIEQSGMFLIPGSTINGSNSVELFNVPTAGSNNNASKVVRRRTNTAMTGNIPVNLRIGLPGALAGLSTDCCSLTYNVCITARVFYENGTCKTCVFSRCFNFNNQ